MLLIMKGVRLLTTITDIRFRNVSSIDSNKQLLANVSIIINNDFVIHDVRIVQNNGKIFVAMPNRKEGDSYRDIVHPLTTDIRKQFEEDILSAYERHIATMAAMS